MKTLLQILVLLVWLPEIYLKAQEEAMKPRFSGQVIGWSNLNIEKPVRDQFGIRYIPSLSGGFALNHNWRLDAEASFNAYASSLVENGDWENDANLKAYRLWLRLSNDQFELRAGLQKINFGSATMLRPLMWFDRIDPRDPLQLTDGVYAVLARYYFLNNANVWLWFLYGNENPKGWELLSTSTNRPEYGGRVQLPVPTGEAALSYHHRKVGPDSLDFSGTREGYTLLSEDRIGIDSKLDIGPGVWFEEVVKHRLKNHLFPEWENYLTLGIDYTFGIGNGLTTTFEQFVLSSSKAREVEAQSTTFSALNLNYPLGMIDRIAAIFYFNWGDNTFYRFLSWQRTYDNLSLYLMAYWNPEKIEIYRNLEGNNLYSGKGLQLMIVFNH